MEDIESTDNGNERAASWKCILERSDQPCHSNYNRHPLPAHWMIPPPPPGIPYNMSACFMYRSQLPVSAAKVQCPASNYSEDLAAAYCSPQVPSLMRTAHPNSLGNMVSYARWNASKHVFRSEKSESSTWCTNARVVNLDLPYGAINNFAYNRFSSESHCNDMRSSYVRHPDALTTPDNYVQQSNILAFDYRYVEQPISSMNQLFSSPSTQAFIGDRRPAHFPMRSEKNIRNKNIETYYCNDCEKDFKNKRKFDEHILLNHFCCNESGCSFKGPINLLRMHKLTHVKNEKGESITESKDEVIKWLERRKNNYPTKFRKNMDPKVKMIQIKKHIGGLEGLIRNAMDSAFGNFIVSNKAKLSFLFPNLQKFLPNQIKCYNLSHGKRFNGIYSRCSKKRKNLSFYSFDFEEDMNQDIEKFPICPFIKNKRKCIYDTKCRKSHDLQAYKIWLRKRAIKDSNDCNKNSISPPRVTLRPPLLYQLVESEIYSYENKLLSCVIFFVRNNFFDYLRYK